MTKAVDLANFSAVPTPEQARCFLDQHFTRAIIGTSFGVVATQQIAVCESVGMDVEEYQFPQRLVATPRRWWLDCETDAANVDVIRAICRSPHPPVGIYTRRGWWLTHTQNWDIAAEFSTLKLWDASYRYPSLPDGSGDPRNATEPPLGFMPYGGFTARAMHQYADSLTVCGINVDLNNVEEGHMPSAEYDELNAKIANNTGAIQGTFGLALRTAQATTEIGRALGDHIQRTGSADDEPRITALQQRMDDLEGRLTNIGRILAP